MRRIRLAASFVVLAAVVFVSRAARAENPHLARARVELDQLKFDEARSSLATALRSGGSTPDELAEIYRLAGQVAAALGDTQEAEESFRRFLALSPGATLPAGTSPKITAPFSAAQAAMQSSQPLVARLEPQPGWPLVVRVVVDSDPLRMIAAAEVVWWIEGEAPQRANEIGDGPIDVKIPLTERPSSKILVTGAVIDRYGNRLREIGTVDDPIVAWEPRGDTSPIDTPIETTRARPFYARPYTWAAVTIGFLGVGTYYAFKVRSTQDELDEIEANGLDHDYSEWVAVKERGEREALIANITFGAAGAFAIVTTILLVRDLTSDDEPAVRAEPVAWPGGGGLFVTGRF